MEEHHNFPDTNRLSVLVSTILLAYALTLYIDIPIQDWEIQLPKAVFYFTFDFPALVSILVAVMAAVGMDWLLRGHPQQRGQNMLQHILLPALTAWVIGIPLGSLSFGLQWWAVFAFGGLLLILVIIAEYVVFDLSDINYAFASVGLISVSFALYLFLCIAIRGAELRLYLVFPTLSLTVALVAIRTLFLRLGGKWCISWAISIALFVGQIGVGIHYLPLKPITFGLILLSISYGIISVVSGFEEGHPLQTLWIEPVIMMGIFLTLSLII